ncbi:MAG: lycopene cyclase domain-containing protein [Actinomycetales bacterium]|nr:lycopene cyclase domain-containing protein [Actinomycetales bacterium]
MRLSYFAVLAFIIVATAGLEAILGARVYRKPLRLLLALLPVLGFFIAWDVYAIVSGHWFFDPERVTGLRLGVVPLEEIAFFIVVPIASLLTFEAIRAIKRWPVADDEPRP